MELLREGSKGPGVQMLQLALSRAGFLESKPDGIFGPQTRQAVILFQAQNGLAADGVVGPKTWAALRPWLTGYLRYTLVRGDTLWKLAQHFGTTVQAIQTANVGLIPNALPVGREIVIPLGFAVVPTNIAYSSALVELIAEGLSVRYPFISSGVVGTSVQGRPLPALALGRGRKRVFFNASHHANEWITTPVVLKYLEEYAEAVASDGTVFGYSARDLFSYTKLYIAPLVNPDGVDLVTGAIGRDSPAYEQALALAQNYPSIPFPNGWKANLAGVDLNLNYPAGWEEAREIKYAQGFTRPGPRDFVGPEPLSEPESRALFDFSVNTNFDLTLSYHAQGRIIYWKYDGYEPPRSYEIAVAMGEASGYTVEETPYASGFAGYKDWFIQSYNRPGYTIEVGLGVSPLPLSQFPSIYRDNIGIMTLALVEA